MELFAVAASVADWTDWLRALFDEHRVLFGWLTTASIALFAISLFALPWLIGRLPADYFTVEGQQRLTAERRSRRTHRWIKLLVRIARNVCGVLIALSGIAMLLLPGQGIIAIVVGLMLVDYPGKHRIERKLMAKPWVHRPLNWLRAKVKKEPFVVPAAST